MKPFRYRAGEPVGLHGYGAGSDRHRGADRAVVVARTVFAGIILGFVLLRLFSVAPWDQSVDAYAYWSTREGDYYAGATVGRLGSYVYPPVFAQLLSAINWLPWPIFNALWTILNCVTLAALAGPWALVALLIPPVPFEIVSGNIHLLMAVAIAAGFRYPALWAFVLLTKATSGVGILWFVVRREWRALAAAAGITGGLAAVSALTDPDAWRQWLNLALTAKVAADTPGWFVPVPLAIRVVAAAAFVTWGALTDRRWTVAVAATIALPVLWLNGFALATAMLPELRARHVGSRGAPDARAGAR